MVPRKRRVFSQLCSLTLRFMTFLKSFCAAKAGLAVTNFCMAPMPTAKTTASASNTVVSPVPNKKGRQCNLRVITCYLWWCFKTLTAVNISGSPSKSQVQFFRLSNTQVSKPGLLSPHYLLFTLYPTTSLSLFVQWLILKHIRYTHTHTHTHTYTRRHTLIHADTRLYMLIHTYAHADTHMYNHSSPVCLSVASTDVTWDTPPMSSTLRPVTSWLPTTCVYINTQVVEITVCVNINTQVLFKLLCSCV